MQKTNIIALTLTFFLTGCQAKSPPTATGALPAASSVSNSNAITVADDQGAIAASKYIALSKQCGDVEAMLVCNSEKPAQGESVDCIKTSLRIKTKSGLVQAIDSPKEMADYTAVGLGCAISSKNKSPYFVVQYGELPTGCSFCEWFYLYDHDGKQLTESDPIILSDKSLPVSNQQFANNEQFGDITKTLALSEADIDFVKCDVELDAAGNPACLKEVKHGKQ